MPYFKKIYRFISSMKLGLLLLAMIGVASALGCSFIPALFYDLVFFKILLLLLLLNLLLCIINRIFIFIDIAESSSSSCNLWIRQTSLFLVHIGLALILVGGSLNVYYGHKTSLSIAMGDSMDISRIFHLNPPFSLRLDEFVIPYNPDGTAAQYFSYVTVEQEGLSPSNHIISVNHPLEYRGIKFYQQSFGFRVKTQQQTGSADNITEGIFSEGDLIQLIGTERTVKIFRYIPNYDPDLGMDSKTIRPDNPRIMFSVYDRQKNLLDIATVTWNQKIEIDDQTYLTFTGVQPFSVLTLKTDPGLPIATLGGTMFMIGVAAVYFISAKRN